MLKTKRPQDFDYQAYLAGREWGLLREAVRERSKDRCEHCFAGPQQAVHHLTYERIGHEELVDLMAVCNPCHEFLSGKTTDSPLNDWLVISPALSSHGRRHRYHLAIPYDHPPDAPTTQSIQAIEIKCRGEASCLWCSYVDDNWPLFAGLLWWHAR